MATFPAHTPPTSASTWIVQWAHAVATGGTVLDVASGNGRHARYFASRGHPVLALDRDATALGGIAGIAGIAGVPGIATREADLENAPWPLQPHEKFAAVVVTNYLHRPLFTHLVDALAPGGVLLYETFAAGNERFGRPSNPAFLLQPGELLGAFGSALRVIAYQDGFISVPRASCVQRLCAVRESVSPDAGITEGNNQAGPDRYVLPG